MCQLTNGPPPTPEHHAAHSCGNGHLGCVHPNHISWKTQSDNAKDAVRHGKYGHGVGWAGKLKPDQVRQIRALKGTASNATIGREFGVNEETIARIFRGTTYASVT